jgi:hypothetical protein
MGEGAVDRLARYIALQEPGIRGFSRPNLFRMKLFYETYQENENVSALLRQLSWTHHVIILGQTKRPEEREFYLRMAAQESWSSRQLERQIRAALFERTVLAPPKVSAVLGKLNFYLETLDRDVRKPHERPTLGLLLCASKDDEVVEYALSRSLSPAMIAEYQTQLPDKRMLAARLREFYLQQAGETDEP